MNNATKIVIGILLMAFGIFWYFGNLPVAGHNLFHYWYAFKLVFEGTFGAFVFFVGLIIAWIGWDDYKMSKVLQENNNEVKEEEKK